ncbi:MAG: carboxypeptidase-like regulatory domain-containing protein [Bacteroidota bacterium]
MLIIRILAFFPFIALAQDLIIEGQLISKEDNEVIPYATLIDITTNATGTTSDEKGYYKLSIPKGTEQHKILISSVAYQDTILTIAQLKQIDQPIKLVPEVNALDPLILSPNGQDFDIGSPFGDILMDESRNYSLSRSFFMGIYVKKNKKHAGLLMSVSVCISEKGFPDAPFILRIMTPKNASIKSMHMNSMLDIEDILPEPVVIQAKKSGWIEINLSKYNVMIPEQDFFIILSPVDKGDIYRYQKGYGISIAPYLRKQKNIMSAIGRKDFLAPVKITWIPAIAVTINR